MIEQLNIGKPSGFNPALFIVTRFPTSISLKCEKVLLKLDEDDLRELSHAVANALQVAMAGAELAHDPEPEPQPDKPVVTYTEVPTVRTIGTPEHEALYSRWIERLADSLEGSSRYPYPLAVPQEEINEAMALAEKRKQNRWISKQWPQTSSSSLSA